MDEENGRGGHREELTIDETPFHLPANSTVSGCLPQLVEHWWGKKGQMHVNAENWRLMGFYMDSQAHQNMRKIALKSNSN